MNKVKIFERILKDIQDSQKIIFDEIFVDNTSKIIVNISDPDNKNTYKTIYNLVKKH